jgi:DNA-binding transcriptional LysR family regulator
MIAVPIGPRVQRMGLAASEAYLAAHGHPAHPRELLQHRCLRVQFSGGRMPVWEFEKGDEAVRIDPPAALLVRPGAAGDLLLAAAVDGLGIVGYFEDGLRPAFDQGLLVPVLEPWWERFPGPFLYFPSRRLLPAPLRAFVDFIKTPSPATG